jgi:hypothetical protein
VIWRSAPRKLYFLKIPYSFWLDNRKEKKMQNKYIKKQYYNDFGCFSFLLQSALYKLKVIAEIFRAVIYHLRKNERQKPRAALTLEHMFDIIVLSLS